MSRRQQLHRINPSAIDPFEHNRQAARLKATRRVIARLPALVAAFVRMAAYACVAATSLAALPAPAREEPSPSFYALAGIPEPED